MTVHISRYPRLLSTATLCLLASAAASNAQTTVLRGNSAANRPTFATIPSAASIPTPADFANARLGTGGPLSQITPNPAWVQSIASDPNAIWQSTIPNGDQVTAPSAVIAIPFDVSRRKLGNVQFALRFAVDNLLGSASCPGIWIGPEGQPPNPLPQTNGLGNFDATTVYNLQFVTHFAPMAVGRNYVYLVLNNEGGPGGIIFTGFVDAPIFTGETILNTDTLQATVQGNITSSTLKGVSYTTSVVAGIVEFRLLGDLNLAANEVISVTGSRPARLVIGGNLNMAAGSSIDASAINASVSAGGGAGAGSAPGGPGGSGRIGFTRSGGNGGSGGVPDCPLGGGTSGSAGDLIFGSSDTFSVRGWNGSTGLPGGLGFASQATQGAGGPSGWGGFQFGLSESYFRANGGAGGAFNLVRGSAGGNGETITATGDNGLTGRSGGPGQIGGRGRSFVGINRLAAGNGGGSGGGGGGGGSGVMGGPGPSGGGGGGGGAAYCASGGAGGAGGQGGQGGQGGNGGDGGQSGVGGGGGGILDVFVLGNVTGSGALLASGGDALPGSAGFAGTDGGPGFTGRLGTPGGAGDVIGGRGGTGGNGGPGGAGGAGARGGAGAGGGGGAGGCVRLFASVQQGFTGRLTARGGASAATPPVMGEDGAVHIAFNNIPTVPTLQGFSFIRPSDAPRATNPLVNGERTPYIPDLPGGPAPFGLLSNVTAAQFFPSRPPLAIMGFRRYFGTSPSPALPLIPGFDYCIIGNLTAADLTNPALGIGGPAAGLRRGGLDADPNFGGSFATLPTLPPGSVWVTLCPQFINGPAQMGCTFLSPVTASAINTFATPTFYVNTPANARLFVDASAPSGGNGSSWATAFTDLQSALALAAAAPAGTGGEVSVAAGLYRPDQGPGQTAGNADAQFTLSRGFTVRGGYGGNAAFVPDSVDPTLYPTILSGDLANDDAPSIQFNGSSLVGTPSSSISGNRSFTFSTWIKYQPRSTRQWVLDFGTRGPVAQNFHVLISPDGTLQTGFYRGWSNTASIANFANTWVHIATIYNATERSLTTLVNGRNVDYDNSAITPNLTTATGTFRVGQQDLGESNFFGGMRNLRVWNTTRTQAQIVADMCQSSSGSEPGLVAYYPMDSVSSGIVPDLAPADGPGNLNFNGAVTITPASRADNTLRIAYADLPPATRASLSSLTLRGSSRAAITIASGGTFSVDDLTVTDCIAEQGTSVVEINYPSTLVATDWIVSGNTSSNNSIVRAFGSALFDRCVFVNNSAAVGIIRSSVFGSPPGSIFLSNSVILNNTVATGAIIRRTAAASSVTVSNCTIVNNAGPFVLDGVTAYNCVLAGNPPINTGVDIRYSLLQAPNPSGGPGNIVGTPQFVNAAAGDFRLVPGSIGVDAGSSSLAAPGAPIDLSGNPRIVDNPSIPDLGEGCPAIDMGAYENTGIIPAAPQFTLQPAPVNALAPTDVQLSAALTGGNVPQTYRWTMDGVELSNGPSAGGGVIFGATTTALTITGAGIADSGEYVLVVRASCLVVISDRASVVIQQVSCPADFNQDGTLDPDDLADYIGAFFTQPPAQSADFNGDGAVDPDDLADYITAFFTGC